MDELTYSRGNLVYRKNGKDTVIEFYYPNNVKWSCIDCGDCCGDIKERTRMILLLPEDIDRIEKKEETDFCEEWVEGSFIGIMCKKDGKCFFYNGESCRIYDERALLCRMYPFWLEKQNDHFVFGMDQECPSRDGESLGIEFYSRLLEDALRATDY
jgi:Fe-S-cluster containining protein